MTERSLTPLSFQPQSVPLLDVSRDNQPLREEILAALAAVYDSGRFLFGPDVSALESAVADLAGTPYAVGCASGSDALLLTLMAAGIGPGDEVIVPSFTFFATASAVSRVGAKIVFVDIDPDTFNIAPERIAQAITPRTRAIIPVHLFGQCAAMPRICEIARSNELFLVEDAAQAIGAKLNGKPAGGWGDIGCFSFYPTKNLGGCGDGGMLTTTSPLWEERLRLFAAHGMSPRYFHSVVGINSRLDSFQAAALRIKINHLGEWTAMRRDNASRYKSLFDEAGLASLIRLPHVSAGAEHVWNQFTIRVPASLRDGLRSHLKECGVGTEIYYPHPLHLQACFRHLGYSQGSLPETERAAAEVLSLPIFPGLTAEEQRVVVGQIGRFFQARQASAA